MGPAIRSRAGRRRASRAAALAATVLLPLGCGDEASGGNGLNVVLISLDSTRRDLLSLYGRPQEMAPEVSTCPNLERLAREGVVMEQAYATTSWTFPSHVSLFTGVPELVHAVDSDDHRPDPALSTLPEILKDHGYRTAGFVSAVYLEPRFGFDRGFDRYDVCYGEALVEGEAALARAQEAVARAARSGDPAALEAAKQAALRARVELERRSRRDTSAAVVTDRALEELDALARSDEPFFLFAHYYEPHYDYTPPAPYDARFDPDYSGAIDGTRFLSNPAVSRPLAGTAGERERVLSDRDLTHVRALYAGELSWTDEQIGRLLARLDELGVAGDTLVVVTADHGSEFFEHGSLGHRRTLNEEVVRVPLLLRLPGRLPRGVRVSGLVSNVDVLATVLELLEIRAPENRASHSFVGLVRGTEGSKDRSVMGRIVRIYPASIEVPRELSERGAVPGQQISVLETYREGAIKIVRERRWIMTSTALPPTLARRLAEERERSYRNEILGWIDVERHPDEAPEDFSSDFSDPRAYRALQRFHDRYVELAQERGSARIQTADDTTLEQLRGLGYLDAGGGNQSLSSDEFALPPPGRRYLP